MDQMPESDLAPENVDMAWRGGAVGAWLRRNPVTLKEIRGRMRGARAFIVLTVYVFLMGLFTTILYLIYTGANQFTLNTSGGVIGKLIFGGIVAVELFLVCFVAPAFTASAISGERERQTYQLLRTTLLPARRLVLGKLMSALAYILLLLLVAVPLQSLAFLMGGVTIPEVLISIELLVITALGYGSMGIFFSAATKRTLNASLLTYAIALLMTIALPLLTLVLTGVGSALVFGLNSGQPAVEALMLYGLTLLAATNPIGTAVMSEVMLLQHGQVFFYTQVISNGVALPLPMPWLVFTITYVLLSVWLVWWSVRKVRQVET